MIDSRLVGETAENIFLSLVNQQGVFATSFDTPGFDGIVFDPEHRLFKFGKTPFYVQVRCRGSSSSHYNAQGISQMTFDRARSMAERLGIPYDSLYLAVGFFKECDIRRIVFFAIPFKSLKLFKMSGQHRFSFKCCEAQEENNGIFRL